jgi:Lar family restriction alleviation protein
MTEELKPCDHCGSDEVKFERHIANGHFENIVRCQKCGIRVVSIADNGREKVIQAWNTRVQPVVPSVNELEDVINDCMDNTPESEDWLSDLQTKIAKAIHALMKGEK